MKTGKNLEALALEIQRQAAVKKDYLVDTSALAMTLPLAEAGTPRGGNDIRLQFADHALEVGGTAHGQIATKMDIPQRYYDRMLTTAPGLLVHNVNWWMAQNPARRMVRTLDGRARAFLSDSYRPLDNLELAEAVLPVLGDLGCEIVSSEITDRKLYIKAVDKRVVRELKLKGKTLGEGHEHFKTDNLSPCIYIGNSEIGDGTLDVKAGTFTEGCTNLAFFSYGSSMKKYHIGGKGQFGDFSEQQIYALLTDQSRFLQDAALWSTVRDVVRGAFDTARFEALIGHLQGAAEQPLAGDIPKVVEVTAKKFNMTEPERKSVLDHLIRGGDLSRYGLHSAITRAAEDLESYDRASDMERIGAQVIELPQNEWRALAEAA